jgi:hypothetical protein
MKAGAELSAGSPEPPAASDFGGVYFADSEANRWALSLSLYRTSAFAPKQTTASTAAHTMSGFARMCDDKDAARRRCFEGGAPYLNSP